MSRSRLNAAATVSAPPVRVRSPRVATTPTPTPQMVTLAQEAFLANKEANAATSRCKAKQKDLSKAMTKAGVDAFEFMGPTLTGGQVRARAAIEPITKDVIDVEVLRTIVDDKTFMRIISATQGKVKEEAGEHVCYKALVTEDCPAELKIKEVK